MGDSVPLGLLPTGWGKGCGVGLVGLVGAALDFACADTGLSRMDPCGPQPIAREKSASAETRTQLPAESICTGTRLHG